ncbi:MAG TPA: hypothetical protein VJ260_07360 [Vicinamibacterales bacterium]|nr:hypothetical protein [Vicinamibacterales bacterium]
MRTRLLAAVAAVALLAGPSAQAQSAKLRQLGGVDELKAWFNANRAHPRAVLLLSPT